MVCAGSKYMTTENSYRATHNEAHRLPCFFCKRLRGLGQRFREDTRWSSYRKTQVGPYYVLYNMYVYVSACGLLIASGTIFSAYNTL